MLSTIGAIVLAIQATTAINMASFQMNNKGLAKPVEIPYQQNPVLVAIVDHYNNKGEWAGTFKIDSITKFKIIESSDNQSFVHVKYFYKYVPNNPKGRTDSGFDQRIFTVSTEGDEVKVIKMGAYRSAQF